MVGTGRFELPTSRLSVVRSNQLSYAPEMRYKFILTCSKNLGKEFANGDAYNLSLIHI